ncbi:MAG: putative Fe-S cluster assembly protein SufT [Gammaproteobacteria bacterium]|jgi:probable FeS assembly SUF system protein SufT
MHSNEPITVLRDVDAILIPSGTPVTLPEGSVVFVTQALGGNYTVNINGNLAQVSAQNGDALGFEVPESPLRDIRSEADGGGSVNEDLLWEQMRTCYDPEIPINIVDLGLIYECRVTPLKDGGNRVDVVMTLTAPGCGMGDFLAADVRQKLAMVPHVTEVYVELTFDPPWSAEMMSEAARLETGLL